jgi:Kef-type K+ transport system membrane component KefB
MSKEFLDLLLAISIVVVAAKLGGWVSRRFGQPAVLGELLAGVLLGPTVLDMLHQFPLFADDHLLAESLGQFAELGVLLLMMLAGLELHLPELLQAGKVSALAGTFGVVAPVVMGFGTAVLFGLGYTEALFIGLALAATSVSISAQTLMELNLLRSRVGLSMLGAAVFDDILVILLLSVVSVFVMGAAGTSGMNSLFFTLLEMVLYLVGASLVGLFLIPRLALKVGQMGLNQGMVAFALVACLLYAWSAEYLGGMAGITGAFMVGLFLAQTPFRSEIETGVSALAYGLFVPIFFVNIGLRVDLTAVFGGAWLLALVLTIVAVVSKIIGCGLGGRVGGLSNREALQLGVGMVSRGEVGLIVAAFAVAQGLISQDTFSITVFMVIVATLATPPLLRLVFANQKQMTAV